MCQESGAKAALAATAYEPTWPYVRPRAEDAIPSRAKVVASPNEKLSALHTHVYSIELRACLSVKIANHHSTQGPLKLIGMYQ